MKPHPAPAFSFLGRVRAYLHRRRLHRAIAGMRELLEGHPTNQWYAFDQLGLRGFGTSLLRVDFPPEVGAESAARRSLRPSPRLETIFAQARPRTRDQLAAILRHVPGRGSWPETPGPDGTTLPAWENPFLTPFDMVALYGMLLEFAPARYVEIGSGVSTLVAHAAKQAGRLATEIISIDPAPRLEIAALCQVNVRARLEDEIERVAALVRAGDILFFDGSHRSFPGSDVTVFFLGLLPRLPGGVLVHVHDIYLPDDYPAPLWDRLWSEQYLLACWLLGGGRGLEIILPCAELARDPHCANLLSAVPRLGGQEPSGSSFWMRLLAP